MSTPQRQLSQEEKIKHLYSRTCYGLTPEQAFSGVHAPIEVHVKHLLEQGKEFAPLNAVHEHLTPPRPYGQMSEEEARAYGRARSAHEELVATAWISRLCSTSTPFPERMTQFWHGHFACRTGHGWLMQQLYDAEREHALGNFRTLLIEVSQTPAMLGFLNNQQNRKGSPNENFARELLELFTMGIGNYKEADIKAAARAFTGWRYNTSTLEYSFDRRQHDTGVKTFFAHTGNLSGDDVIDIVLKRRDCAQFIATKLYTFFVNETPDAANIERLTNVLYSSGYQIAPTMEYMLTSDWFYEPKNVGNMIKSPVDLIVGLSRQFGVRYDDPRILMRFQRSLGQTLFYPPNVAGWPGGQKWIDSSSLMARMKLASTVLNAGVIETEGKADPEDEAFIALLRREQKRVSQRVRSHPDWAMLRKNMPAGADAEQIGSWLLTPRLPKQWYSRIDPLDYKSIAIQIASTPEYQLA